MQMPAFEKHVWAEIDLDALRHNFRDFFQSCFSITHSSCTITVH